ncbi:hypothetical protein WJX73_006748 [Symbiochloris irregularis]|uniref:Uncharacterized protein n=1 Tax=Symbiochloris irregularis TaxID=706552 RepID=A0AAW1NQ26_9CHLO
MEGNMFGCGTDSLQEGVVRRNEELLLQDVSNLLAHVALPEYLIKLYQSVKDLRCGQHAVFLDEFLPNIREYRHNIWLVTQKMADQLLQPAVLAQLQTEMKLAVALFRLVCSAARQTDALEYSRATAALLRSHTSAYASLPIQTMLRAQQTQLEDLQLSMSQVASLAKMGMEVFAELRSLNAESRSEDSQQQPLKSLAASREAKLEAAGRCLAKCQVQSLLSDEQFIRYQAKRRDDPFIPHIHPMLLVLVDSCLKPRAPRLPKTSACRLQGSQHLQQRDAGADWSLIPMRLRRL